MIVENNGLTLNHKESGSSETCLCTDEIPKEGTHEFRVKYRHNGNYNGMIGVIDINADVNKQVRQNFSWCYYKGGGKCIKGGHDGYGAAYSSGDIITVRINI